MEQVVKNASSFADKFISLGYKVISGGTDNHMFVLDTYNSIGLTGKEVETMLDEINITVNKNQIPNDKLPPLKSSGVRIGTPAMTTKGWKTSDFERLAIIINEYLKDEDRLNKINQYKSAVSNLIEMVSIREDL